MIESNWLDDGAAIRVLNVMEERCFELSNATEVLDGLIERYFCASYVGDKRKQCAEQASADYAGICAVLAMVRNVLLDIDMELDAAIGGDDTRLKYRKTYVDSITEQPQEAAQ